VKSIAYWETYPGNFDDDTTRPHIKMIYAFQSWTISVFKISHYPNLIAAFLTHCLRSCFSTPAPFEKERQSLAFIKTTSI